MKIVTIHDKKEAKILAKKISSADLANLTKDKKTLRALITEMKATMRAADGVGLSANQVGLDLRLFVAEVATNQNASPKFYAIFNPEIIKKSTETAAQEEGCLSVPRKFGAVERSQKIVITGFDINGRKIKIKAWGLLARVFQHEIDHLNGILFTSKAKDLHEIENSVNGNR